MYKFIFLILVFIISVNSFAQFRVEEISIKGELTEGDPFNANFGRFDPVELYLTKGDVINISVTAEYPPFIALVAPSEKYYVEYTKDGSTIQNYLKTISESGTWYLSIAGDSTDTGSYNLTAYYMSANSILLPPDADFCTTLKFLIEHSKVNFFFMKKLLKDENQRLWESKINLAGNNNSYISEKDNLYGGILFETNTKEDAVKFFSAKQEEIKKCLGLDWINNSKDLSALNSKEELFVILEKDIKKSVKLILAQDKNNGNYKVSVEIKSEK